MMAWLARILNVFRRTRLDRDIDAELAFHAEMRAREYERQGMTAAAARAEAHRRLGNPLALRDRTRDIDVAVRLETAWLDCKYGIRMLARTPSFAVPAVLTLALGIGANTAMFALLYGILLRPLPYPAPDRLYLVFQTSEAAGRTRSAPLDFLDWRERTRAFSSLAAHVGTGFTLTGGGDPELVIGQLVSADLFDVLGVRPLLGRSFHAEEMEAGRNQVIVLGHALWLRRFGGDPAIVGRTIVANAKPYTIVGVMPAGFTYPSARYELWTPFPFRGANTDNLPVNRDSRYLQVLGRLRDGVSPIQARADMSSVAQSLARQFPGTHAGHGIQIASLLEETVGEVRPAVLLVFGAAVFVLLIACANVTSLLLARFAARARELAVRCALGASAARLVRQFLVETLVLYALGGTVGVLLASGLLSAVRVLAPADLPRVHDVRLVAPVLVFTFIAALLAALAFGVAPAWYSLRRAKPLQALTARGATHGRAQQRFRTTVLVGQIAVALLLLTGASLAVRSLINLQAVQKGFDPSGAVTFSVSMPAARFPDAPALQAFYRRFLDTFASQRMFEAVGLTTHLPLSGQDLENGFTVTGYVPPSATAMPIAGLRGTSPGYLRAMGIPLRRGRDFTLADREQSQRVVLVNESFANRYWRGLDPLGRQLSMGGSDPWRTVVGVIADVKHRGLDTEARPEVLVPFLQLDPDVLTSWARGLSVVIRSTAAADTVIATARQQMRVVDPMLPMVTPRPMNDLVSDAVGQPRFRTFLLGTFAALALALALVGVFGVMSYFVSQRTQEIGIRMALGATSRDVLRAVLLHGARVVGTGIVAGLAAAVALTRSMQALLFGVTPDDPLTFLIASALLALAGVLACYVPARRATQVKPVVALRAE